jgi:hypothetical protein
MFAQFEVDSSLVADTEMHHLPSLIWDGRISEQLESSTTLEKAFASEDGGTRHSVQSSAHLILSKIALTLGDASAFRIIPASAASFPTM